MSKGFPNDAPTAGLLSVENLLSDVGALGGGLTSLLKGTGKAENKYMTGSRAIIKINNKLVGFAHSVTFRVNTSQTDILTIDDWTPYEIAPSRVSIEGTLGMFHIPGKGASAELIQSNILSFLHHQYITIEIKDRTTDHLIFKTNRAVITSRYQELNAGQMSNVVINFKAMGWVDEMKPEYPKGHTGESLILPKVP